MGSIAFKNMKWTFGIGYGINILKKTWTGNLKLKDSKQLKVIVLTKGIPHSSTFRFPLLHQPLLPARSNVSCGLSGQVLFGSGLVACFLPGGLGLETLLDVARGRDSSPKFFEKRRAKLNDATSLRVVGN